MFWGFEHLPINARSLRSRDVVSPFTVSSRSCGGSFKGSNPFGGSGRDQFSFQGVPNPCQNFIELFKKIIECKFVICRSAIEGFYQFHTLLSC